MVTVSDDIMVCLVYLVCHARIEMIVAIVDVQKTSRKEADSSHDDEALLN